MKINQISVFLENTKGRLNEVCELLGEHSVNIRALTIAESQDFGVVRLVVDKTAEAVKVLKGAGFVTSLTDIVAVEVEDKPGGLGAILKILSDNSINVEYMYGFVEKSSDKALLVFRFDEPDKAIAVLKKHKVTIVGGKDVKEL